MKPRILASLLGLTIVSTALADEQSVSIEQIAAAIEKHIAEKAEAGGGYLRLAHNGKELKLKLIRVHMEYLADLGGGAQFACVDLFDVAGDVYDVDFFLKGVPGDMTVTETTVHKINGQPYYAWEQKEDGTWVHVPVDPTSSRQLGVVYEKDAFEFTYRVTLPEIAGPARMWLPLPVSDDFQAVEVKSILAPGTRRILEEREHGNRVLFLELGPADSAKIVELKYQVRRIEKEIYPSRAAEDPAKFLRPEGRVPIDKKFRDIAAKAVKGKKGDVARARALYDHVIDAMRYQKFGDYGRGDAVYACDVGTGNCTEYHSYFIALARSIGIPARFAVGAAIPAERDDGGIDGYHCWAEFHADGKWWPVDISEADKYTSLATYYFGHNPANRIEYSRGRDLVVEPGPVAGPINFLAFPVLEVAGKPIKAQTEFLFRRVSDALTGAAANSKL